MLEQQIVDVYSKIHTPIQYTNGNEISFEGSQIQYEFFKVWNLIEEYYKNNPTKKLNFLEVGAWKGLWGIAFTEFCKLNNIEGSYLTLTLIDQDPNNIPLYKTLEYINSQNIKANLVNINSLSEHALPQILTYSDSFNIVFIDAAHDYNSVMSDIKKFAPLANDMLLFHDIRPKQVDESCGVYQSILDSGINLDEEIVSNEGIMGIGITYIKSN
jgi:hypothetical protein